MTSQNQDAPDPGEPSQLRDTQYLQVQQVQPLIFDLQNLNIGSSPDSAPKPWHNLMDGADQRLAFIKQSNVMPDLTIAFPCQERTILVHRLMLSVSSPVFEAMLNGPLAEGSYLILPEDMPQAFEWMLQYLYMDRKDLPGAIGATQVYELADKYQIDPLCRLCSQYLLANLKLSNLLYIFNIAILLNNEDLINACSPIIALWSDEVLSSPEIGVLCKVAMGKLIRHPGLGPSTELILYKGLLNWARSHQNKDNRCTRLKMVEFLSEVRFLTMSEEEFIDHVIPTEVFHSDESDNVLAVMRHTEGARLPLLVPCSLTSSRDNHVRRLQLYKNIRPTTKTPTLHYRNVNHHTIVDHLEVTSAIFVRQFLSTGLVDIESSNLMVMRPDGSPVAEGIWRGIGCKFERPFVLFPEVKYTIKVWTHKGLSSFGGQPVKACDCFNGVLLKGNLYYSHLVIEFMEA